MDKLQWELLTEIQGRLEAELLKSYLEAHEIGTELIQESVGHTAFPVTVDGLGRVQVFVPRKKARLARDLLNEFRGNPDARQE